MKFLIAGGYSHGNPGDEAILKATVYRLQDLFPSAAFGIWAGVSNFKVSFDRPVTHEFIHWQPLGWTNHRTPLSRLLTKLYTDGYPLSYGILKMLNRFDKKMANKIGDFDKVVFVGGGYLNSDFCLLEMHYLASCAGRLGKPIYLLGQTLGPFRKKQHRRMAQEIFTAAEKILLRDAESAREVLDFKHKVYRGVDDALAFNPRLSKGDRAAVDPYFVSSRPGQTFFLGINLRDWAGARRYYSRVAEAVESFTRSFTGCHVRLIFIPMETSRYGDDRREAKEFGRYLSPAADYEWVAEALSVEQTFYLISRLDFLVGMRLHSLVFALASGVPAIGLYHGEYYARKLSGLFEPFGEDLRRVALDHLENLEAILRETASDHACLRHTLLEKKVKIVKRQESLLKNQLKEKERALKVSVIIPTLNRAVDLQMVLESLMKQTVLPDEIIVVDQSTDRQSERVVSEIQGLHAGKPIHFHYLPQEEKSLVKARNRGLSRAAGDIVSFLDDDVVLFGNYFEEVVRRFESDPTVGALSGNTLIPHKWTGIKWTVRKALMRFFLLSRFDGRMTASGFGYPIYEREIEKDTAVDFLPGCNMNFRRENIEKERFDEWFTGYGFREDADFSYRVSRKTRTVMIPDARLYHHYSAENRLDAVSLKKMEIQNYYHVFRKYKGGSPLSKCLFAYSLLGLAVIDLLEFLTSRRAAKLYKFRASVRAAVSLK